MSVVISETVDITRISVEGGTDQRIVVDAPLEVPRIEVTDNGTQLNIVFANQGVQGPAGTNGTSFNWVGTYAAQDEYSINDVVQYGGSSYISVADNNQGHTPPSTNWWELMVQAGSTGATGATGAQGPATVVSESEPLSANVGEQWFNPTTQVLQVYTSSGYKPVGADDLYF